MLRLVYMVVQAHLPQEGQADKTPGVSLAESRHNGAKGSQQKRRAAGWVMGRAAGRNGAAQKHPGQQHGYRRRLRLRRPLARLQES